jgi:hypothetical protein
MKAKNWTEQDKSEFNRNQAEKRSSSFYGRTHNESVPFTQVNFQTYQNILDQRNELLNGVRANNLL